MFGAGPCSTIGGPTRILIHSMQIAVFGRGSCAKAAGAKVDDKRTNDKLLPVSHPNPGRWMKYYQGKWDQPGVGGDSTGLANGVGGSVARWKPTKETLLLGWTHGGVGLQFSTDANTFTTFTTLREPLLVLDPGIWNRPAPSENGSAYKLEAKSGYLMTVADSVKPSVELEDCVSQWPGHPDHMLDQKGLCESDRYGFQRLRTAGWVYSKPQEQTVPLYRCYNAQEQTHFASNAADCEKLGAMERLLGY